MLYSKIIGIAASFFLAHTALCQGSTYDVRATSDIAKIDIAKIADETKKWGVVRLDPHTSSGAQTTIDYKIDSETGKIVVKQEWPEAMLDYRGRWKLLHSFKENQTVDAGQYHWQNPNADYEEYREDPRIHLYDPFVGDGGKLLVSPMGGSDPILKIWDNVLLLFENSDVDLIESVNVWRDISDDGKLSEKERWDHIYKKLPDNIYVLVGRLQYILENIHKYKDTDVVNITVSDDKRIFSIAAAVISNANHLTAIKRSKLLIKLGEQASLDQRYDILFGILSVDIKNSKPEICSTLIPSPSGNTLINQVNIDKLPDILRAYLQNYMEARESVIKSREKNRKK